MTQAQQQKNAQAFADKWTGHGYEKGETQKFWLDLLGSVFGRDDLTDFIFFEEQVKQQTGTKTITNFIDAYIPSTRVMIEQKSSHKDLCAPIRQSDGSLLTPFQQAKKYVAELPLSLHPKWIVACNFHSFLIYDMEHPTREPEEVFLKDLQRDLYRLRFLVDDQSEYIRREEVVSLQAGELVGRLYDALYKEYISPSQHSLRSLNILCVRIVFCLYAEDAGLFGSKTCFEDYIRQFAVQHVRDGLIKLFRALDTPMQSRDKYDTSLLPFPYVNGGIFRDQNIEIPNFTEDIVRVIVEQCAPFDWSEISPTIFGAVFESTLNPETRRGGGMHYTSIANIHKLIDPLFLNDLYEQFDNIAKTPQTSQRAALLLAFQDKLARLTFLDPACGSGNFLTETYLSLRHLENKLLALLDNETDDPKQQKIKVHITQFFGIEINDFAVAVAKTALWIAQSQMLAQTEAATNQIFDPLPLSDQANIVEGNALHLNWATLQPIDPTQFPDTGSLFEGFATKPDGSEHHYNYIFGNPPFVGARMMTEEQKKDVAAVFGKMKNVGNLDYVACWYKKAASLMSNSDTKTALVSTNSITQGEQVSILWKELFQNEGVQIEFAYRTFRWDSESTDKAHVHCVIICFSTHGLAPTKPRCIYNADGSIEDANNINGYLLNAPSIYIESRQTPLCPVPPIGIGNQPIDDGNYLFTEDEMKAFVKKEPAAEKYFRKWYGADEFIKQRHRYCLWLGNCSPAEIKKMPECYKRVQAVRQFRLESKRVSTRKLADTPTHFQVENFPQDNYIVIPETSSEKRRYVPIGFLTLDVFCSNALRLIPNASLFHFGVLTSSVHMAWMRAVCGRLKSDYRYSKDIVYNNFPWPDREAKMLKNTKFNSSNKDGKEENIVSKIERTAQAIIDARAHYPDSSLADLYDETLMPADLRRAHRANDAAVMAAYGFAPDTSETDIVAGLFKLYQEMTK